MPSNDKISLRTKLGQLVMFGFTGNTMHDDLYQLLHNDHVGNLIFFKRNITTAKQVFDLNRAIQQAAHLPVLCGIDQEGGLVTAIDDIVPTPGAMAAAASGHLLAYEAACEAAGLALKSLGFGVNFAPVADINTHPDNPSINARSYGDDPNEVARYSVHAFNGYERARLMTTAKHFPGLGDTHIDSHLGLPQTSRSLLKLEAHEWIPFSALIKAGLPGVMTGHIVNTAIDERPATLSKTTLTSLLRNQLHFKGFIMTDLLSMHAIKDHYPLQESIILALNAGVDLLLYDAANVEDYRHFLSLMADAVLRGAVPMSRIDDAYARMMTLKARYDVGKIAACFTDIADDLSPPQARQRAQMITDDAVTCIRNKHLPIDYKHAAIVFPDVSIYSLIDNDTRVRQTFGEVLKTLGFHVPEFSLPENATASVIDTLIGKLTSYQHIIVFTYNSFMAPAQQALIEALDGHRLIWIALRSPYDGFVNKKGTYLCAYEATIPAFKAIDKALRGVHAMVGVCPVRMHRT